MIIYYQKLRNHRNLQNIYSVEQTNFLDRKPVCLGKFTNFLANLQAKYCTTSSIQHSYINTEVIKRSAQINRFSQTNNYTQILGLNLVHTTLKNPRWLLNHMENNLYLVTLTSKYIQTEGWQASFTVSKGPAYLNIRLDLLG